MRQYASDVRRSYLCVHVKVEKVSEGARDRGHLVTNAVFPAAGSREKRLGCKSCAEKLRLPQHAIKVDIRSQWMWKGRSPAFKAPVEAFLLRRTSSLAMLFSRWSDHSESLISSYLRFYTDHI